VITEIEKEAKSYETAGTAAKQSQSFVVVNQL
jgi:hypothetical protein